MKYVVQSVGFILEIITYDQDRDVIPIKVIQK